MSDVRRAVLYLTAGVARDRAERTITCEKVLTEYVAHHVFSVNTTVAPGQIALRGAWMRNLD